MESSIFEVIESALMSAGYRVLDGDKDSVIISHLSGDKDYVIRVDEIPNDEI